MSALREFMDLLTEMEVYNETSYGGSVVAESFPSQGVVVATFLEEDDAVYFVTDLQQVEGRGYAVEGELSGRAVEVPISDLTDWKRNAIHE